MYIKALCIFFFWKGTAGVFVCMSTSSHPTTRSRAIKKERRRPHRSLVISFFSLALLAFVIFNLIGAFVYKTKNTTYADRHFVTEP